MSYCHEYHPYHGLILPGPSKCNIGPCTPQSLYRYTSELGDAGEMASPEAIASKQYLHAWGFGPQHWDPMVMKYLPSGWICDLKEGLATCEDLLHDINDLVRK
jgi:hypothetical protein